MDEAFRPFSAMIRDLLTHQAAFVDAESGSAILMTAIELELPLELDVGRSGEGALAIGSSPPIYTVRTSMLPSFHRVRLRATTTWGPDAE